MSGDNNAAKEHTMKACLNDIIQYDNKLWRVIGIGAAREDGLIYYHLASTTEVIQQRNGQRAKQCGVWL